MVSAGNERILGAKEGFRSSNVGILSRRARDGDGDADAASELARLKELHRQNDPEAVIRAFESTNSSALSAYIQALMKVDRLNESISNSVKKVESVSGFSAPIDMVAEESGDFRVQLWLSIRTLLVAFLIICGTEALFVDSGIAKVGIIGEVQPILESSPNCVHV